YDDQVPSPPSLLKVRRQSVRLCDQPALFWSDWGKSSAREIGRIFERFLHFLGQAHRTGNPLGRLASGVLGLRHPRVIAALRQQLPGDSSHQTCRSQNCDVGLLAKRSLAFVEVSEVGRATDGNPSGLDEGPAKPFVAMWEQFALKGLTPAAAGGRTQAGVATKLLSRGEALDAINLGDDHGGQDRSHTGKAAHVLERRTLLKQAF